MLRLVPTLRDGLDALLSMEEPPNVARWLGDTGRAWHERALADSHQNHWTAMCDGDPVGFAVLVTHLGSELGSEVEIRRLVVAPQCQGLGHGRDLLREALHRAYSQLSASHVFLDVRPENTRALALYTAEGFVESFRLQSEHGPLVVMSHQAALPRSPQGLTRPLDT